MRTADKHPAAAQIDAAASHWLARCDAGLTEDERGEFSRWASDPRHASALSRHAQAWALLDRPSATGTADAMIAELGQRDRNRQRRRRAWAIAGAFGVMLAAIGFRELDSTPAPQSLVASTTQAIAVWPKTRTLPDGSVVELRSGAQISVVFNDASRRVVLQSGMAHFQVREDKSRPFVVVAQGIEIRAVGTAFAVQMESAHVDVLVTEGRVAVEKTPGATATAAMQPLALVDAGNRAVVATGREQDVTVVVTPLAETETQERLAWRETRLEFTATPLAQAVKMMNRYNQVQFVIRDPALAEMEVSGLFRADNTDAFLLLLKGSLDINAKREADTIFLGVP